MADIWLVPKLEQRLETLRKKDVNKRAVRLKVYPGVMEINATRNKSEREEEAATKRQTNGVFSDLY